MMLQIIFIFAQICHFASQGLESRAVTLIRMIMFYYIIIMFTVKGMIIIDLHHMKHQGSQFQQKENLAAIFTILIIQRAV